MSELTLAVLRSDLRAVEIAKREGATAVPELQALLANPDPGVRMVAIRALGVISDTTSIKALFLAARDEHGQVAKEAVEELEKRSEQLDINQVLQALAEAPDPTPRRRLALLLGKMPLDAAAITSLIQLTQHESAPEAKIGCLAALARKGHLDAAKEFNHLTSNFSGRESLEIIRLLEYIDQPWILERLRAMLSNKENALFLNLDMFPDRPQFMRVCDLAANAILRLTQAPLTFAKHPPTNYNDSQLDELRKAVWSKP